MQEIQEGDLYWPKEKLFQANFTHQGETKGKQCELRNTCLLEEPFANHTFVFGPLVRLASFLFGQIWYKRGGRIGASLR